MPARRREKSNRKRLPSLLDPLFLILLTVLTHWMLLKGAPSLLNSDVAPNLIVANHFREGSWSAFYFNLPYGGVALTVIRAIWASLFESLLPTPTAFISSQSTFSYVVVPVLMTLSAYWLGRCYFSRMAALFTGMITAVGFQFWLNQYGVDYYFAYLILGCALLGWRARISNPWVELKPWQLFLAGTLSGFAVYTSRISLLYVLPFFVPWEHFKKDLKRALSPQDSIERWLLGSVFFFLALYVYLESFTGELGQWNNRTVKLHSEPNLKFALIIAVLLEAKIRWKDIRQTWVKRFTLAGAGFIAGFAPEIVHWVMLGQLPPPATGGTIDVPNAFLLLGRSPQVFRELFSSGNGLGRNLSVLLLLSALVAFVARARKDRRLTPAVITGVLCVYAFCRVHTYTFGTPRYLLPVFPVILIALGALWEELARIGSRRPIVYAVFVAIVLGHSLSQLQTRREWSREAQASHRFEQVMEIVHRFDEAGVRLVMSDDYWESSHYTFFAQEKTIYSLTEGAGLVHPKTRALVASEVKAGLMTHDRLLPDSVKDTVVRRFDHDWRISSLGQANGLYLYLAERLK